MKRLLASIAPAKIKRALLKKKKNMPLLDYDLTRFDEQDIILERAGVFLPKSISVEFIKKDNERPKVIVYQKKGSKSTRLLELKLVMVAAT
ncbi:hypothetical protein N9747_05740 [Planktomarina sp.]|nr:hypothetical protein [Planktomarina sp.]